MQDVAAGRGGSGVAPDRVEIQRAGGRIRVHDEELHLMELGRVGLGHGRERELDDALAGRDLDLGRLHGVRPVVGREHFQGELLAALDPQGKAVAGQVADAAVEPEDRDAVDGVLGVIHELAGLAVAGIRVLFGRFHRQDGRRTVGAAVFRFPDRFHRSFVGIAVDALLDDGGVVMQDVAAGCTDEGRQRDKAEQHGRCQKRAEDPLFHVHPPFLIPVIL